MKRVQWMERVAAQAWQDSDSRLSPLLRDLYARRGVVDDGSASRELSDLIPPGCIEGMDAAVECLAHHVEAGSRLLVVGDYDADGATSTALCLRAFDALGRRADFLLPDRATEGYGLSAGLVDRILERAPQLVVTVDTGISSVEGVARLRQAGIEVLITDHHLPGPHLPDANAILNPNLQPGSVAGNLAGVGVAFYLMLALRAHLRTRGYFHDRDEPAFDRLLDLVAIGTVADLVPLDRNNRILVEQGLRRLRASACSAGIRALIKVSGRELQCLGSEDIAFALAPRINAAGRLEDMRLGVRCLLAEDERRARELARSLDEINQYRQERQQEMSDQAEALLPAVDTLHSSRVVVQYREDWHEGLVGIIASRIKDRVHRPTICLAPGADGLLKGSGRSIPGIHLRDLLDRVDKLNPGIIHRFGGHAMAAGLSLDPVGLERFNEELERALEEVDEACFEDQILHDGELTPQQMSLQQALEIEQAGPWGQRFPKPLFLGRFHVLNSRILQQRHLKLLLQPLPGGAALDAIQFQANPDMMSRLPDRIETLYELSINRFRGNETLQLMIRDLRAGS